MEYVLGLDLGARSLGWAAIERTGESDSRLLGLGVRIFEAGMDGAMERGKEESRAAARREARNQRRQTRRRRQRARLLYRQLAGIGLLPPVTHSPKHPEAVEIQGALNKLDAALRAKFAGDPDVHQLPYLLRARALDHALEPYELGRAIYHLGQRRGFQSNRKARVKEDEEKGKVYGGIRRLKEDLKGFRTLGELFASYPRGKRIRGQYTHRDMYRDEFKLIWEAQRDRYPALTRDWYISTASLLFDQRPLQSKEDEIGFCEWIPDERRAPAWSLEFQRFRLLQNVVHLRLQEPSGVLQKLTPDQRERLVARLETEKELTFKSAKKILGIPEEWKFSIEEGKGSKFKGNIVGYSLLKYLPDLWSRSDGPARSRLVSQIAEASSNEDAIALLTSEWKVAPDAAQLFVEKVSLPKGYVSLSIKALKAVIPLMEEGLSVQEARQKAGFEVEKTLPVHALLPPVKDAPFDVRNPAVLRSLTELRKVVNAVVRRWGKPDEIHIELARELKKNKEARQKESARMRQREDLRGKMKERIEKEIGQGRAKSWEIELGLLYDECGGICPYTGESLGSFSSLFSGHGKAQIEHIIPRRLCPDDSFENRTLATVEGNAEKGNRTPFEAFGRVDPARFEEIIERVKNFKGEYARRKLARFRTEDTSTLLDEFSARILNDTRYASRVAADYLALLYGGRKTDGRQRIFTLTGQMVSDLRGLWNLNSILSSDGQKSRDDHRHHAIDAVVIALIRQKWVGELCSAAERSWRERKRRYAGIPFPWEGFKEDVERAIQNVRVSVRPDHRVSGALHKETFYRRTGISKGGGDVVRTRRPVHLLNPGEQERIVDPRVRAIVTEAIERAGGAAKLENNWPTLPNANGAPVVIKNVRIDLNRAVSQIGHGYKQRFAEGGESHHVAVYEVTKKGKRVWEGRVVSMSEAQQRVRQGRNRVVDRLEQDGRGFLFSLCKNDTIVLSDPTGLRTGIWVVKKIYKQIMLVPLNDARAERQRVTFEPTVSGLQRFAARRVVIGPLGEISPCHD